MSDTVTAMDIKRTDPSRSTQARTGRYFSALYTEPEPNSTIHPFDHGPSPGNSYIPSQTNRSQSMHDFSSNSVDFDEKDGDEEVFDQVNT